ncbi:MAG: hypothetical protein KF896_06015 [Ignavibacteriae bacterium]|nr:hypothetical protein [Ignavibacteriota bacterium]
MNINKYISELDTNRFDILVAKLNIEYDDIKLKAYTSDELENELKYQIGIFVCLDTNKKIGNAITKYFQKGNERK